MGDLFHLPVAETQVRQLRVLGTSVRAAAAPTISVTQTGGAGAVATITAGAAIQPNSAGGDIALVAGANTGSGSAGQVLIPVGSTTRPGLAFNAGTTDGLSRTTSNQVGWLINNTVSVLIANQGDMTLHNGVGTLKFGSSGTGSPDVGLKRAAAGIVEVNSTGAGVLRWLVDAGRAKVTSQFDKTNDSTLADITGLSIACLSGRTYHFRAQLFVDANVTAGSKYAAAYSSTVSAIKFKINLLDDTTNTYTVTSRQTTSGGSAGQASTTAGEAILEGEFTTTGAGNLTIQFAQNVATPVTTSSVLTLSNLLVWDSN